MFLFDILQALLFVSQILGVQSQCNFREEMLCGDECIAVSQLCQCGSQSLNMVNLRSYVCCNTTPCQNGTCPDGIAQLHSSQCNGQCPIYPLGGGGTFLCENFNICRDDSAMCKGFTMCGTDNFTFTPNEMVYCSTEDSQRCQGWNKYPCGQVHGAHYTNVGCYEKVSSTSRQMFQCANRMDLASSMFNTAIMNFEQTKITAQKTLNLNTQLNFNETHLNCSEDLVIAWNNLFQPWKSDQKCLMQDGNQIQLLDLTIGAFSLVYDYSFKESNIIGRMWNRSFLMHNMCQFDATSKCSPNIEECINDMQLCDGIGNVTPLFFCLKL